MINYISKATDFKNPQPATIEGAVNDIKNGKYERIISSLRCIKEKNGIEAYKAEKSKVLPAWSFNGTFYDSVTNSNFKESSGLFHFDIDGIVDATKLKKIIASMNTCVFCFISPSGDGIKGALRIDKNIVKNDADFKKAFAQVSDFFDASGITIDASCKDVRRLCFVSHDPDIYYNPDALVFPIEFKEDPKQQQKKEYKQQSNKSNINDPESVVIERIINTLSHAGNGERHHKRLSVSRFAGGCIAGGLIGQQKAEDIIFQISDSIADKGVTSRIETKTILDGIEYGKKSPITDIFVARKHEFKEDIAGNTNTENHEDTQQETPEAQEWNKNLSGDIDYIIPFDCVARDIQQWILSKSIYPQPAIAYAAAMIVLSAVGGRRLRIGNIKANLMFVCMAESGEGKDFPLKCSENLIAACKVAVEGEPASGAAFFDALNNNQGHAHFSIDEFGHFLREISAKNANQYLKEVGRGFTKAYTSASSSLLGKRTKGNDPAEIKEPHITLFGLATERQVFDNVKSSDLADGSLARYSMIFGNNGLLPKNVEQDSTPPEHLIKKVKEWCEAFEFSVFEKSEEMAINECFSSAKFKLVYDTKERTNALVNRGGEKAAFAPFYNRIAVRSVQSAMLLDKCSSVDVLDWCSKLEISGCDTFVKKCLHLSSDNDFEKQSKHLQAKIKESGKKGISHSELIKATQSIPTHARKSLLEEFIKSDLIFQNNIKINGSQRPTCFYFWSKKTQ